MIRCWFKILGDVTYNFRAETPIWRLCHTYLLSATRCQSETAFQTTMSPFIFCCNKFTITKFDQFRPAQLVVITLGIYSLFFAAWCVFQPVNSDQGYKWQFSIKLWGGDIKQTEDRQAPALLWYVFERRISSNWLIVAVQSDTSVW